MPNFANGHVALAKVLLKQGHFSEAKAANQKALSLLRPDHPLSKTASQQLQECVARLAIDAGEMGKLLDLPAVTVGKLMPDGVRDMFPPTKQSFRKGYLVRLTAGMSYQIDLTGEFDTLVRIEDAQQHPLLSSAGMPRPGDNDARLVFTPEKDGLYRLIVNSAKPGQIGSYTLKVQSVAKQGRTHLVQGDLTQSGPAHQGKFFQTHKVRLTAGMPYVIELESRKFDTYLILLDADGKTMLAANDDIVPDENLNSRLDFTPQRTSEFVLQVTSFEPGQTGAYTLKIQGYATPKQDGKDRDKSP